MFIHCPSESIGIFEKDTFAVFLFALFPYYNEGPGGTAIKNIFNRVWCTLVNSRSGHQFALPQKVPHTTSVFCLVLLRRQSSSVETTVSVINIISYLKLTHICTIHQSASFQFHLRTNTMTVLRTSSLDYSIFTLRLTVSTETYSSGQFIQIYKVQLMILSFNSYFYLIESQWHPYCVGTFRTSPYAFLKAPLPLDTTLLKKTLSLEECGRSRQTKSRPMGGRFSWDLICCWSCRDGYGSI